MRSPDLPVPALIGPDSPPPCLCFCCVLLFFQRTAAFLFPRWAHASVSGLDTKGVQESSLPLQFLPETPVTIAPTCLHSVSVAVIKNKQTNKHPGKQSNLMENGVYFGLGFQVTFRYRWEAKVGPSITPTAQGTDAHMLSDLLAMLG